MEVEQIANDSKEKSPEETERQKEFKPKKQKNVTDAEKVDYGTYHR